MAFASAAANPQFQREVPERGGGAPMETKTNPLIEQPVIVGHSPNPLGQAAKKPGSYDLTKIVSRGFVSLHCTACPSKGRESRPAECHREPTLPFFWTTADLENKLLDFRTYFNKPSHTYVTERANAGYARVATSRKLPVVRQNSTRSQPLCNQRLPKLGNQNPT